MAASLIDTLETLGFRIERGGDLFDILLQLWCSVRVTEDGHGLTLEPRFGFVSRSAASWGTVLVVFLLWFTSRGRPNTDLYLVGFAVLLGVIWDVYRYILTEHAMDTVRQVYLATRFSHA